MNENQNVREFINVAISDDGLAVTNSDADVSTWPNTTQDNNLDGERIYYRPVNYDEPKSQHYLTKLGEALANALCETVRGIRIPKRT